MSKEILLLTAAVVAAAYPFGVLAQDENHEHNDDEIIVTGSPIAHPEHESIIAASVLTKEDLAKRGESSIGELLRREPGVSSTFFGPAASRPVIRGLSGDRVSVLDAGIGAIDVSSVSDDHAVAIEPATAERIEIVRGAATLYYGSSAAGGVVNVFDGRIPDKIPNGGIAGGLRTSLGSVDDSAEAAGSVDIKLGSVGEADLVFHGDGFARNTDDYGIPGFAKSEAQSALDGVADGDETFGVVENSDLESKGGSIGGSLIFDNGFFGVSGKITRSNYGVPGAVEEGPGGEIETVRIELEQERFDLMGELNSDFLIFETAKIRIGYADYVHRELEGRAVGTTFKNEGYEGRIEFIEKTFGKFRGASGLQFKHRDFEALGDEAFTPANITDQFGMFTMREYETGNFHIQLGGRYEHTNIDAKSVRLERSFDAVSVSAGFGVEPNENLFFGVNLLRTERVPAPEELFSDGPHLATNAFELGDPALGKETARGVETSVHSEFGPVSFRINGFYTDYRNFIALTPNGDEEDGLPVFEFVASDAVFKGFEALAEADLFSFGAFEVTGRAQLDYVRARFKDGAGNVPRIPPLRSIIGMEATSSHIDLRGEIELADGQNNISAFELSTEGYQIVNLAATWRPGGEDHGFSVQLRADNVTDEEARLHTSFLKETAPLPGRNIKLTLRATF
jgi:iron complex outermembrane recepter protein